MVSGTRRRALSALPLAALLALSGCDVGRGLNQLRDAIRWLVGLIVAALVLQVVLFVVGLVGAVMLERKTPSLGWGIAAIACGVLQLLPTGFLLVFGLGGPLSISVIEVIVLGYVGIRNVRLAPRRRAPLRDSIPPDDDPA